MHNLAPGITVNGVHISPEQISAEVQYHSAPTLLEAKYEAMHALVIRELMLQEAIRQGIATRAVADQSPDEVIELLLSREVLVPTPTESERRRYYENNRQKFYTSPLFEVSHILYLADPADKGARKAALKKAQAALAEIKKKRSLFKAIAIRDSACQSGKDGGRLGQIGKGQTVPAFEAALLNMQAGDTSDEPVASEVGYHIIRVHKRVEGNLLPFDAVSDWIAKTLSEQSWTRAFSQYIQLLAGKSEISGFKLRKTNTPLVQ